MHISMCQWRGLRSIVAVSFMHRLKTKSSTKGVCPREQDVVRGSISLSARTHGSEKKTKHTHTHDSCMCSGCTDGWHNVFLPLARYDRERERRAWTEAAGASYRKWASRGGQESSSNTQTFTDTPLILKAVSSIIIQPTVSPVYNMPDIFSFYIFRGLNSVFTVQYCVQV